MSSNPNTKLPSASLIKQLAAMLYDGFLILAILFVATIIALLFNKGEAIESSPVFTLYLVLVIFLFYSWFWSKCGQTLGMRVWKIQIINDYGKNPAWQVCILRLVFAVFSMACLGLGYWWRLFRPYTWHDKLSQTRIIDISRVS
jgi:uncharacterized RDD family membrane protein YckC